MIILTLTYSFGFQCNRLLRWCPSADCSYAVKVAYVESRPVACKCGHVFCFECGENWHDPVLCKYLKKWIKKCDDDSETSNWIAANTKECPKCNVTIEKDGGCNHMVITFNILSHSTYSFASIAFYLNGINLNV